MFDVLGAPDTSSSKRTCSFAPLSAHFLKNSCMPEFIRQYIQCCQGQIMIFLRLSQFSNKLGGNVEWEFSYSGPSGCFGITLMPAVPPGCCFFLSHFPKLLKIVTWFIAHLLTSAPRTGIPYVGHMSGSSCANFMENAVKLPDIQPSWPTAVV